MTVTSVAGNDILNLACGGDRMDGAVGLDIKAGPNVDVVHDLDVYPYPFEDNRFSRVEFAHGLEHLAKPVRVMAEIHRIARPGALVHIITPHYTSQASYGDMTHYHHFGRVTFTHLCERGAYELVEDKLTFTDFYKVLGIAWMANRWPRRWEKYCAFQFPAMNIDVVLRVLK